MIILKPKPGKGAEQGRERKMSGNSSFRLVIVALCLIVVGVGAWSKLAERKLKSDGEGFEKLAVEELKFLLPGKEIKLDVQYFYIDTSELCMTLAFRLSVGEFRLSKVIHISDLSGEVPFMLDKGAIDFADMVQEEYKAAHRDKKKQ